LVGTLVGGERNRSMMSAKARIQKFVRMDTCWWFAWST
jgi:hypothetical protein